MKHYNESKTILVLKDNGKNETMASPKTASSEDETENPYGLSQGGW